MFQLACMVTTTRSIMAGHEKFTCKLKLDDYARMMFSVNQDVFLCSEITISCLSLYHP